MLRKNKSAAGWQQQDSTPHLHDNARRFGKYTDMPNGFCETMAVLKNRKVAEEMNEVQAGPLRMPSVQVGFCKTKKTVLPRVRHAPSDHVRCAHGR